MHNVIIEYATQWTSKRHESGNGAHRSLYVNM